MAQGVYGRKSPSGVQGRSPGREPGERSLPGSQKLKQLADTVYRL